MKNWLYISITCALIATILLLWDKNPELLNPLKQDNSSFERFPYAVLHDAQTRHFDDNGVLSYEFDAVTLKHFRVDMKTNSDADYALMVAPQLTLYSDKEPWKIMAKNGKVTEQGNKLTLWGEVQVRQLAPDGSYTTELTTESLDIYPSIKRLTTLEHVRVVSETGTVDADGLEVDMLTQRIKLLANVRGHHEPIQ